MSQYENTLKQILSEENVADEPASRIVTKITTAFNFTESKPAEKIEKQGNNNELITKLLDMVRDNPQVLLDLFKTSAVKYLFDFGIALIIVSALVILSLKGILGTCETATILGGVVGYLLGHANK